jgi:hypothetical protein
MSILASYIARLGRCIALWFLIVLPLSPSIWALCAIGPTCFDPLWTAQGEHPAECLAGLDLLAPFAAMFGSLAHDGEEPLSKLPEVLLTAFILAVLIRS